MTGKKQFILFLVELLLNDRKIYTALQVSPTDDIGFVIN